MKVINVMIADDHAMIREGLKQLLELDGEIRVINEAGNGEECLNKVELVNPDVLLLDINMPKKNGLEVLEILKERGCTTKILILTIHNEVEYLAKAVKIGINGYVLKDSPAETLKKAIFTVYNGDTFIQPSLANVLEAEMENKTKKLMEKENDLTKREVEVLCLLAEGLYNKEIAFQLNISEKTVKNHVSSIFRKIDVADRTQAAVYAIKNNLVKL